MGGAYPAESSQKRGVAHAAASGCWRASIARRAITARRTGADGLLWTYRLLVSCHAPRQPERRGGGGGGREEGERGVRRGAAAPLAPRNRALKRDRGRPRQFKVLILFLLHIWRNKKKVLKMEYLSERVKWCGLHHSTGQHWRESRLGWGSPPIRPQVES